MDDQQQLPLFSPEPLVAEVKSIIRNLLGTRVQPSAWELLKAIDQCGDLRARWGVTQAVQELLKDAALSIAARAYLRGLAQSQDLREALRGVTRPGQQIESSVDTLIRQSKAYRHSDAFQEMITFMANFRDYAPFNNMLVRLQNPSCSFFATERDWKRRFNRQLKEDPRPMIILAPMRPVMLVYDLDQTRGDPMPQEVLRFAHFEGDWDPKRLARTVRNARHHDRVRVDFKPLSSTHAGFATISLGDGQSKMRVAIHKQLPAPSRYGVLCHELAHIYLGHLGGDEDGWWASRGELSLKAMEVEAEAATYIVARRCGLFGSSPAYVCRYLDGDKLPEGVSVDLVAKVANRLEEMADRQLAKRRASRKKGAS